MHDVIPQRFRREILLHLYKNLLREAGFEVPLILGIHGPSGQGKTYQCQRVLEEVGTHIAIISGGELESAEAGEPARLIRHRYSECSDARYRIGGGFGPAVLVINDIDAAVGQWGDLTQYTVNRQNVFGELMNLADSPTLVEGRQVLRVPILVTGNDFTKLYPPLVRVGRMHSFSWVPTVEERLSILESVFPDLSPGDRYRLSDEFPDQPIAFFSHLKSQAHDDFLWNIIEESGAHEAFCRISAGSKPKLKQNPNLEQLISMGMEMLEKGRLLDHLVG